MHRKEFLSLLAVSPLLASSLTSRPAGKGLVDTFRDRYSGLRSIDLQFSSSVLSGRLLAVKGGSYRIEASDRTLVCDGASVWNAQHTSRTVVIDRFDPRSEAFSLDRIFFVLLNVYVPSEQKTRAGNVVRLVPPDPSALIIGIEMVDLALDRKGNVIRLDVTEGGTTTAWKISQVRVNPKIDAARFRYSAPAGWNVIDLR